MRIRRSLGRVRAWARSARVDWDVRILSPWAMAAAWIRNRNVPIERLTFEKLRHARRTETLFILGSGPSLLDVTPDQWSYVSRHDSFGINYSFMVDFVPTYHLIEDGKEHWHREFTKGILAPRRSKLGPSIWFLSERKPRRGYHPRFVPELFPEPARICAFQLPPRLVLDRDRPFTAADFAHSIRYRGTLSLAMYLALELGYRRLVLLGVDLHTTRHFFFDMPEMQPFVERLSPDRRDEALPYPQMKPRAGLYRPLDEYLVALEALHLRPKGIELSVGSKTSTVPLPTFTAWDGDGA